MKKYIGLAHKLKIILSGRGSTVVHECSGFLNGYLFSSLESQSDREQERRQVITHPMCLALSTHNNQG